MTKGYFVAHLKESSIGYGAHQYFDHQCIHVQAMDEHSNLVAFYTKEDGQSRFQVLAIIPRENILAIERVEMEVEDDE